MCDDVIGVLQNTIDAGIGKNHASHSAYRKHEDESDRPQHRSFELDRAAPHAQDFTALVAAPDRTEADRQADAKRNPVALLAFIAPKPGWQVLDMAAGGGYSTELMARAVAPDGKVFAQTSKPSEKLAVRMWSAMKRID